MSDLRREVSRARDEVLALQGLASDIERALAKAERAARQPVEMKS